jgi:Tol biopolymer transport system component/tRNA A-37 threonylcarbamoyl transferase component Bud32
VAEQKEGPHLAPGEKSERASPEGRTGPLEALGATPAAQRAGATAAAAGPPALLTGDVLSERYRVVRFIARGGMGEVYEAEHLDLRERIAIKILRPGIAQDPRTMQRFRRESQLSRKVTHPNVCRIFDIEYHRTEGPGNELTFITMEFLDGETLSDRLKRAGRMTTAEAFPIVVQMAQGLAAADKAGIVHRDFKSHNVMLVPSVGENEGPRAVVTDFGMARGGDAEQAASLTATGVVVGTPAYMAPEQVEGKEAEAAADIYSLGVVLYEMVTGSWPFGGETPLSQAVKRLTESPPSPRSLVPDLDPRWEEAIMRCLERRPEDRYASALDVVRTLSGEAVAPSRRILRARRRRLLLAASGVVLLALSALAWRAFRARAGLPDAGVIRPENLVQLTTSSGLDVFPSFSPDGKSLAYASDRTGSFEIYVRPFAGGEREIQLTSDGQQNVQPAWSPDGSRIAYHSKGRGGIWLLPATGGTPRQLCSFGSRPAWSPDSSTLAFQSDTLVDLTAIAGAQTSLWLAPAQGGQPSPLTRLGSPPGDHGSPAWSPDGKRIVFVAEARTSSLWSVSAKGDDLFRVTEERFRTFDPVLSPRGDGVYFAAISENQSHGIWKASLSLQNGRPRGEPVQIANLGITTLRHLTISTDGSRIAYSAQSMKSNLLSLHLSGRSSETAGDPRALTAETVRNSFPVFSPDGGRVAFIKFRPGVNSDVWVVDAEGANPHQLTSDPAIDYFPSWLPGGERVAFQSNRGGSWALWSVELTGREAPFGRELGDLDVPRLSPDGTQVLFQSNRGGATNVWTVPIGGGPPRQITFDAELMGFGCWSPDGRLLAVEAKRGDDQQIAVVPSQGGPTRQLTSGRGQNWLHSFSPDGDKIAFAGLRSGSWNLFWISVSSGEEKQLTRYSKPSASVRYPAWSPRGDRIVYEYAETTGNIWIADGLK